MGKRGTKSLPKNHAKNEKKRIRKEKKWAKREEQMAQYSCECCGKGGDEVSIALTRNWGLACDDCINNGSMSKQVGVDVTAYKIEDVPDGYRQRL